MELRLSASISSSSSASLPTPLGAMASEDSQGVEKEAWRMEFCPPSHIEAFAGEIKSIVAR